MFNAAMMIEDSIEYKTSLKNSIFSVFFLIQNEIFSIIEFLNHNKDDYIINIYPLTIERVDGKPVSEILISCLRARLVSRGVIS